MGEPDLSYNSPEGEVFLDTKTVEVISKISKLRTIRDWYPRFPRKVKKKLKKFHGDNYGVWLTSPIRWVPESKIDVHSYHNVDAEKELTQLLIDELNNENNKKN